MSVSGEQAGRGMVWCSALCGGVCLWVVLSSLRGDCALLKLYSFVMSPSASCVLLAAAHLL